MALMIEFNGNQIGKEEQPYIVAEAGVNFRDDIELGKAFIEQAAESGADAIKFQTHIPEAEMVESEMYNLGMGSLYERMNVYSLSMEEHRVLRDYCKEYNITFLSTPFSTAAVERLEDLNVKAYKVGSGELTNYPLLRTIAKTGKPMIISTGMHSRETIRETYEFLSQYTESFMFLYCVSEYPTEPSDFNLGYIKDLKEEFDVPIGFSDHSTGIKASAIAMARGADLVEKHFTIDRRLPGGDQEVSIEPEELRTLVEYADLSHKTQDAERNVSSDETSIAEWARHSIVVENSVSAGETLSESDLTTKRPGTGIPATEFDSIVGRAVTRDLDPDTILQESDLSTSSEIDV